MSALQIDVALAGNPNSGKTTLFNALTGSRQHVGNYPGITVEQKEGYSHANGETLHFVDLPGTYSLTAYSQEELVARNILAGHTPHMVVDVVNAGALERNLYLAVQIMELGLPLILALNMMDEIRSRGLTINTELLSRRLGAPVVETVARQGLGQSLLKQKILSVAHRNREESQPLNISYGPDLDPVLQKMVQKIEDNSFLTSTYPPRWIALKYLEGDEEVRANGLSEDRELARELEEIAADIADHCQKTLNTYPEAIIADYRYGYISSLLKDVISRDTHQERLRFSDRMDKVLTHRFLGPIIMVLVLYGVYEATFWLGEAPMAWLGAFFDWLKLNLAGIMPDGLLQSLVISGIIDGVGGVLGFVPLIAVMFLCVSFLEDSGYMARVAYMLDRIFRIFGLHGCSVMPFIISGGIAGGCAVPGVMSTRTLRSRKEKLATMLTAPFMTCGAKLPVFLLLAGVFFAEHQAMVLFLISLAGWFFALLISRILRWTVIKGPSTPFVMELPPYRLPTSRGILIHTWERAWEYIKKAGTVILGISVLLWAAMTFPQLPDKKVHSFENKISRVEQKAEQGVLPQQEAKEKIRSIRKELGQNKLRHSVAGRMGSWLEPVTSLAGFDWKMNISLIGGFAAKEVIISTLGTAYSLGQIPAEGQPSLARKIAADPGWNTAKAVSSILFILLYAPCFVTVVTIAKESGSWKWAGFGLIFNTLVAYILAVSVYQSLLLF